MTTRSDDILAGLLAECSDSILAGASVKACLDRHPQHATALEPLLTTLVDVHELRAVPVRSSATAARSREQFMAAAMRLTEERRTPPVTWWERLAAWWAGIVAIFVPPAGQPGVGHAGRAARRYACCDPGRRAGHRRRHGLCQGAARRPPLSDQDQQRARPVVHRARPDGAQRSSSRNSRRAAATRRRLSPSRAGM